MNGRITAPYQRQIPMQLFLFCWNVWFIIHFWDVITISKKWNKMLLNPSTYLIYNITMQCISTFVVWPTHLFPLSPLVSRFIDVYLVNLTVLKYVIRSPQEASQSQTLLRPQSHQGARRGRLWHWGEVIMDTPIRFSAVKLENHLKAFVDGIGQ